MIRPPFSSARHQARARLVALAWRNLWRNPRRSLITLTALVLSTVVLIVTDALMHGLLLQMEHSVTDLSVGEVQVHNRRYLGERNLYDTISAPGAILEVARNHGIPATGRAFGYGLLSGGTKSAGVQFLGIEPNSERRVSDLADNVLMGAFIGGAPQQGVVLGRKLARTLNAGLGDELVVVVQAADGSLGNTILHVRGILKSIGETQDRSLALIHALDFAELFVFEGRIHEIALNSRGALTPEEIAALLLPASGDNAVKTWRQLRPTLSDMLTTYAGMTLIFEFIFFLAAGLGVLNTMLMATYERIPEFGLIKAIGASPGRVVADVLSEALVLGVAASLIGGPTGTLIAWYLARHPLDLSGFAEGFNTSGVALSTDWGAVVTLPGTLVPVVFLWLVVLLAALYPAVKAARLDPVEALAHV